MPQGTQDVVAAPEAEGTVPHRLDPAELAVRRESRRLRRLRRIAAVLGPVALVLWVQLLRGRPVGLPPLGWIDPLYLVPILFFTGLMVSMFGMMFVSGRSPHVLYRPEQIDVRMSDVKGLAPVAEDVARSLEVFLAGRSFRTEMGGTPRRGLLFEGLPGTGKTLMAKAMAAEAGVPFLFVSGTSFESMYYGATARKIRSYFKALRKAARAEGGAIGFIEEIDAIATVRGGLSARPTGLGRAERAVLGCGGLVGLPAAPVAPVAIRPGPVVNPNTMAEGVGGVVNELLVQMQSFDQPTGWQQARSWATDKVNLLLPAHRQIPRPRLPQAEILLIAATNRADSLDPALLRPGRFDRRLVFDLPDKAGRRELVDHFLDRKAHESVLDGEEYRDALAGVTQGFSPVMIEHLLDEALVNAVRRGARGMSWADIERARVVTQVGLGQPVGYTEHERRLIATHEAGHAVVAWLVAPDRRLEVLTIIKRAGSLGLLAHGDRDDVYTRSRRELEGLIRIAFGGQVAEELFFDDISTGPSGDLAYATSLAAQMVGQAGMDRTLISFAAGQASAFTAGDVVSRTLGDSQAREMVEDLLRAQRDEVRALLGGHRHLVGALRDALLEHEELIGSEITDVLRVAAARPAEPDPVPGLAPARTPSGRQHEGVVIDLRRDQLTEGSGFGRPDVT